MTALTLPKNGREDIVVGRLNDGRVDIRIHNRHLKTDGTGKSVRTNKGLVIPKAHLRALGEYLMSAAPPASAPKAGEAPR